MFRGIGSSMGRSGSGAVAAGSGAQGASSINAASRAADAASPGEAVALVADGATSTRRAGDSDEGAGWSQEEQRRYVKGLGIAKLPGEEHVVQFVTDCLGLSPLPKPWEMHRDSQGRIFYGSMSSGETSWRHPLEDVFRELAGVCRVIISLTRDLREPCVANLRETWEAFAKDEFSQWYSVLDPSSGMEYYCNSATGQTMWEHPAEVLLPGHYLKLKAADRLLDEDYLMEILTLGGGSTKEGSDGTASSFYQRTLMNSSLSSFNKQDEGMKEQFDQTIFQLEAHKNETEAQRAEITKVRADFKDAVDRYEAVQRNAENADKNRQEIQAQFDIERKRAEDALAECETLRSEKEQMAQSLAQTKRSELAVEKRLADVEQELADNKAIHEAVSAAAASAAAADPEAHTNNAVIVEEVLSHIAKAARDFREVSSDLQRARAECADLVVRHAESENNAGSLSDDRQAKLNELEQELARIRGNVTADTDRMSATQIELDKVLKELAESKASALQDTKFRGELEAKLREAKAQIEELKAASQPISISVADGDLLEELGPFSIGKALPETVAAVQAQLAAAAAEFEMARTDFAKLSEEQAQAQLEAQETDNLFRTSRTRLQELAEKEAHQASAMQITASAVTDAAALAEQASKSDLMEEVLSHIAKAAKEFQEVSAEAQKTKTAYAELVDRHALVEKKALDATSLSDERQAKLNQVEQELVDKEAVRAMMATDEAAGVATEDQASHQELVMDVLHRINSAAKDFQKVSADAQQARAESARLAGKVAETEKKASNTSDLEDKLREAKGQIEELKAKVQDTSVLSSTQAELDKARKELGRKESRSWSQLEDELRGAKEEIASLSAKLQAEAFQHAAGTAIADAIDVAGEQSGPPALPEKPEKPEKDSAKALQEPAKELPPTEDTMAALQEAETLVVQELAAHAKSKEAETSVAQGLAAHAESQAVAEEPAEEDPPPKGSMEEASKHAQGKEADEEPAAMEPPLAADSKPAPEDFVPTPKVAAAREKEVELPTTKIEFAFKNLDFAAVMAKPEIRAGLTSQVQKGISEHVGVPPERVQVTLMAGSVMVLATIPCEDAVSAVGVSTAASGGDLLGAIGQLAADVPGIAATMAPGHSDFGLGGLKTKVHAPTTKATAFAEVPTEKPGLAEKLQKVSAGTAELQSSIAATTNVLKPSDRAEESKKELGAKMAELKQVLETQALPLEAKKALTDGKHRSSLRRRKPFKTVEHRGRTWARRQDALAVAKQVQYLESESAVSRCQTEHMQTFVNAFDSAFAVKMKLQLHKESLQNFNQALRSEVSQLQEQLRQLEGRRDSLKLS